VSPAVRTVILLVVFVLVALGILGILSTIQKHYLWTVEKDIRNRLIDEANAQLGITYTTEYRAGKLSMILTAVQPNSPMAKAGFKAGDSPQYPVGVFYEKFMFGAGKEITVSILRQDMKLEIKMIGPLLQLSEDPAPIHWDLNKKE
jgi:hypothetical protein